MRTHQTLELPEHCARPGATAALKLYGCRNEQSRTAIHDFVREVELLNDEIAVFEQHAVWRGRLLRILVTSQAHRVNADAFNPTVHEELSHFAAQVNVFRQESLAVSATVSAARVQQYNVACAKITGTRL